MDKNPCTVTLGPVRFSYLNCFEPKAMNEGEQKRYSVSALVPKSNKALIAQINEAIEQAKIVGRDKKFGGKIPANLKLPLRDGDVDRPESAEYAGHMFFSAHSAQRPGIVDSSRNPIIEQDEIYSGAYGYLNVTFYPYEARGSKGIAVAFNHIMKTEDGERLAGRVDIDEAFASVPVGNAPAGNAASSLL